MDGGAERHEALVIGAGHAGLAAAAMLRRAGVETLVLERTAVGSAWRSRYDRLHLHTHRVISGLPGLRFARRHGPWVPKDDVVRYLERYVDHHALDVRTGVTVRRIEREDDLWLLPTENGTLYAAPVVVVATGYNAVPKVPDWPGLDGYTGELVHGSQYRNAEPYRGRDVLVVGTGNTGSEVAVDLVEHEAARVRVSVRNPPHVFERSTLGFPANAGTTLLHRLPPRILDPLLGVYARLTVGDLTRHGLPRPRRGVKADFLVRDVTPILDFGFADALRAGRVEIVAGVVAFDGPKVLLADGTAIEPDAVIAATGYRRGLEGLVGHMGILDERGRPRSAGGAADPATPGLYFVGFTNPLSGAFWEASFEARRVARAVAAGSSRPGSSRPPVRSAA
jgi:putative flavoprotein involved in K+ transport